LARRLGATEEQLAAVARGDEAPFEPAWRAALRFATAVTPVAPHVDDATYGELASHWTPAQIVEITSVISLFSYFNRFALALRIPVTR
jgi:alkylhydroperoxidase family enzyme